MNNTKHAPGPWHVAEWEVRDNDGAVEAGGWQVVGADGYAINTCISEGDGEQEEANLHFIVRACNSHDQLVSSLRNLIAATDAYSTMHAPDGDDVARMVEYAEALNNARAVLAAAGAA